MGLIVTNFVAAVLNVLYYIFTDVDTLAPFNLFVGGMCFGVSFTLIVCRRY